MEKKQITERLTQILHNTQLHIPLAEILCSEGFAKPISKPESAGQWLPVCGRLSTLSCDSMINGEVLGVIIEQSKKKKKYLYFVGVNDHSDCGKRWDLE